MIWVIIIVLIIAMTALMLPVIAKAILNHALRKMDGYTGQIDKLHLNLFNSQISIHTIAIRKDIDPNDDKTLLLIPTITILFSWTQLLRRILDVTIIVDKPQLFFIAEIPSSEEDNANHLHELPILKNHIEKLMSFIATIEVHDGQIQYENAHSRPPIQIVATGVSLTIQNFSNRLALSKSCTIFATSLVYEGNAKINATLFPLEPTLTVDLNLQLQSINLVLLNNLVRKYGKVNLNKGTLDLYAEVVVMNNSFKGYVKPLLKDLDFISAAERRDNIIQKIWKTIVAGFYNVLKNKRNDQVATKIPIEGRLNDPHVRVGVAIVGLLRNAFVKALTPSFDHVINIQSIWNIAGSGTKSVLKTFFTNAR